MNMNRENLSIFSDFSGPEILRAPFWMEKARSIIYVSVVSVRVSLIIIYGWGFLEEMYWRCFCNCVKVAYSWGLIDTIGNIILFYYDSIISYSDNSG